MAREATRLLRPLCPPGSPGPPEPPDLLIPLPPVPWLLPRAARSGSSSNSSSKSILHEITAVTVVTPESVLQAGKVRACTFPEAGTGVALTRGLTRFHKLSPSFSNSVGVATLHCTAQTHQFINTALLLTAHTAPKERLGKTEKSWLPRHSWNTHLTALVILGLIC